MCLIVLLASCDQRLEIDDPKEEVQTPLPDGGDSSGDGESDSDIDSGGSDTCQEGSGGNQGGSEGGSEGTGGDESGSEGGSEGDGSDQEGAGGDQDGSGQDNGGSDGIEGDDTGGDDEDGDSDMDDGDNGSDGGDTDDGGGNSGEGGGSDGDVGSNGDSDGDSDGGSGEDGDGNSGEEGDSDEEVETGLTVRFAEGVSLESGWYDVNKVKDGTVNGDINMCWAASCANIIQWWQDRYVEAGNTLPAGAVTGPGTKIYPEGYKYNLALMELYRDLWWNGKGGDTDHGVIWYFEGRNVQKYASEGSHAQPNDNTSGGYYSSIWNQILPKVYHEYKSDIFPNEFYNLISKEYNNYSNWGNGSGVSGIQQLKKFSATTGVTKALMDYPIDNEVLDELDPYQQTIMNLRANNRVVNQYGNNAMYRNYSTTLVYSASSPGYTPTIGTTKYSSILEVFGKRTDEYNDAWRIFTELGQNEGSWAEMLAALQ